MLDDIDIKTERYVTFIGFEQFNSSFCSFSYKPDANVTETIVDIPFPSNTPQNVPLKVEIYEGSSTLIENNRRDNNVNVQEGEVIFTS